VCEEKQLANAMIVLLGEQKTQTEKSKTKFSFLFLSALY
jgi:hypothetical protein